MTFESLGFQKADTTIHPRLVIAVDGMEKCGKTHFALTAPGPIALFDEDIGTEGVVAKFAGKKDIWHMPFSVPDNYKAAEQMLIKVTKAYKEALQVARTVVIDTASGLWELVRMARFGKLTQIKGHHYGPVNAEFRALIREDAMRSKANVILLHKMKKQYVQDKKSGDGNWNGKYERTGFGETGYLVQANLRVYRDPATVQFIEDDEGEEQEERKPGAFHIKVNDSRHNEKAQGMVFDGFMCTFPIIAMALQPESTAADWR